MKAFPQPLSREEEQFYMQKYTEGDLNAKHILIERNLRLVAHIVKKYQHADTDQEDFISIGTIGLIKAVTTFNPKRNNRLASYAARCIENEILMFLRSKKNLPKRSLSTIPSEQTAKAMKSSSMIYWKQKSLTPKHKSPYMMIFNFFIQK